MGGLRVLARDDGSSSGEQGVDAGEVEILDTPHLGHHSPPSPSLPHALLFGSLPSYAVPTMQIVFVRRRGVLPRRYVSTSGELGRGAVEIAGCLQNQKVCICGVNDCFFAHHLTIATRAELHSEARQFLRRHDVSMSGKQGRGVVDVVECIMMWMVRVRVVNGYFC